MSINSEFFEGGFSPRRLCGTLPAWNFTNKYNMLAIILFDRVYKLNFDRTRVWKPRSEMLMVYTTIELSRPHTEVRVLP